MPNNKFEMKIRQDDDSFVCDITNGSICLSVSNDGEEEDMQAIVNALNKPNVKWYSNNKLELDQHIEIMQLQGENEALKQQVATLHEKKKRGAEVHRKLFLAHMALQQQHQELKERAQRLVDMLEKASRYIRNDQYGEGAKLAAIIRDEIQSVLSEYNQSKEGKEALARTVVAIAEDVSKDAESAEAYLKSEGVDVEKVKADAAYFAWKAKLIAVTESKTGSPFNGTINDEEARKWYESGATPYQCFRETWQSDGD